MTHIKYVSLSFSRMDLYFLNADTSIACHSFKLHATARQLHEWTRREKMKLKEHAVVEMAKEKQVQDPCREEKGSSAEAEVNETFEGEMDNFQTPLVRCGASAPFFFTELTDAVTIHPPGLFSSAVLFPWCVFHSSIPQVEVDGSSRLIEYAGCPSGLS